MGAYYNEFDHGKAEWLRQLIIDGLIASGDVDERDIREVKADDLLGYKQCHFFAGIGGWSIALRMAGWPDDKPVWTGSCPCQSFSTAGKGRAQSDERHLWPDWYRLIRQSKPATIFGEQVENAITKGWLDDIFHNLEEEAYACAAAVLPAYSIEKIHERERIYFVAYAPGAGKWREAGNILETYGRQERELSQLFNGSDMRHDTNTDRKRLALWDERIGLKKAYEAQQRSEFERVLATRDWRQWETLTNLRLLAHGLPSGMVKLAIHGLGDAIIPEVAAEFIEAAM